MTGPACRIRLACGDDAFILAQVPRFVDFTLPAWRQRPACIEGIRGDLSRQLEDEPPNSFLFVAEDGDGAPVGFIQLQKTQDFFTGRSNAHIANLAVAQAHEGRGIGKALMAHAQAWAREHRCVLLTLAVFPGNQRARALYEAEGFGVDLLRMAKPIG